MPESSALPPESLCQACQNPFQGQAYPQSSEARPTCWKTLPEAFVWLPRRESQCLFRCENCRTIWWLGWNPRDAFFESFRLPSELESLLGADVTPSALLEALERHPGSGRFNSLLNKLAKKRFASPILSVNAQCLLELLSREDVPLWLARQAVSLLESVLHGAVDQAFPEDFGLGSETNRVLTEKLNQKLQQGMGVVAGTQAAYKEWLQERPVQSLPPLRDLNLEPLERWLQVRPDKELSTSVSSFRARLRELLLKFGKQAKRQPPIVTLTGKSQELVDRYRNFEHWQKRCLQSLEQQVEQEESLNELEFL